MKVFAGKTFHFVDDIRMSFVRSVHLHGYELLLSYLLIIHCYNCYTRGLDELEE